MTEDDHLSEAEKILFSGPIVVDAAMTTDALATKLEERLAALLDFYDCDATPSGLKELALKMALEHSIDGKRVMEVRGSGVRAKKSPGRPKEYGWFTNGLRIASMLKFYPNKFDRIEDAANYIKRNDKNLDVTVGTLKNNYTKFNKNFEIIEEGELGCPAIIGRCTDDGMDSSCELDDALHLAAQRLEEKSRKP